MATKTISCLPSDILALAFCRLEAECLVQCTSVCKSWHHIIKSSFFAKAHLTHQKASSNAKRVYFSLELFQKALNIGDACNLRIHGISDGLLCISKDGTYGPLRGYCVGDDLYLVNPICRKAKKLPELKITKEDDGLIRKGGVSFGFYDNDYKVVVVSCVDREYVVSVYSLTSNCWNVIHTNCYYEHKIEGRRDVFCVMQPTKFVDGIAYMIINLFRRWPISNLTSNAIPPLTVCFDLRDETILQFKCPIKFLGHHAQCKMEAYGETIAVLLCDSKHGYLSMWILCRDKISTKSPWENKLVIKLKQACDYAIPIGFLYNDKYMVMTAITYERRVETTYEYGVQIMYESAKHTTFYLYDLESKEVKEYSSTEDYSDHRCKLDSDCVENVLLLNEDSVDPFVDMEMESFCSFNKNLRKRKR